MTFFEDLDYVNIKYFVDVTTVVKYGTVWSMYWVNAFLILISTGIFPSQPNNTEFDSFYDHSGQENTVKWWVGWVAWILYMAVVVFDSFVQSYYEECLLEWKEWAMIEMVTQE